jgi:putative membrane protein
MIFGVHPLATEAARTRLRAAVAHVEGRSAAEVVVAVRPQSDRYTDVDLVVAAVAAWIALLWTLFAPTECDLDAIAVIVPLVGGLGFYVSRLVAPVRRALARASRMEAAVDRAAKVCFVDKRVTFTRGRTGVLVYVSLFERRIALVADAGVDRAVAAEHRAAWESATTKLFAVARATDLRDAEALARAIEGLGDALEPALPRSTDDLDELPDFADA